MNVNYLELPTILNMKKSKYEQCPVNAQQSDIMKHLFL